MTIPSNWVEAPLTEVTDLNPSNPELVPTDDTLVSFVPMAAVEENTGRMDASAAKR